MLAEPLSADSGEAAANVLLQRGVAMQLAVGLDLGWAAADLARPGISCRGRLGSSRSSGMRQEGHLGQQAEALALP